MARRKRSQRGKNHGSLFKRTADGCWIARWTAADGSRPERSTGTRDKGDAERILKEWISRESLRREGIIRTDDERFAAAARVPIARHIDDWQAAIKAGGNTEKHAATVAKHAREILVERCGCERLADVSAADVQSAVGELVAEGVAVRTAHYHQRDCKAFMGWLVREKRIPQSPLAHLKGLRFDADKRVERRALDDDEAARLIRAATAGPAFRGLDGPARAMLYRVALGTGFRAGELSRLTVGDFRLDDDRPAVRLVAGSAKNRRETLQPIRVELAEALRMHFKGRSRSSVAFPGRWCKPAAAMLRADMRRARARWIRETSDRAERRDRRDTDFLRDLDADGRRADFHSLRVTFITGLVRGGVPVKVAQELARHSTPTLTLGVYTKLGVHDLTTGLDVLPDLTAGADSDDGRESLAATGTDHATAAENGPTDPRQYPRQLHRVSSHDGARRRTIKASMLAGEKCDKPRGKRTILHDDARSCAEGGGGIRTHESRICNPLP
jgi:integrase